MPKQIVIIGSGFAGMMAGLAASHLRHEKNVSPEELSITVVSRTPQMVVRPRLYERDPHTMVASLTDVFAATDINHAAAGSRPIRQRGQNTIGVKGADGQIGNPPYDRPSSPRAARASGRPYPASAEFGHSATALEDASPLDRHLHALADRPASPARSIVVVVAAASRP